jgi:hypothetical protein
LILSWWSIQVAYELHITRGWYRPIRIKRWEAAVKETPNVRLSTADWVVVTPPPNVFELRRPAERGDAEVLLPSGEWIKVFYFSGGRVHFNAAFALDDPDDPVRKVATALARRLGARNVGDEGEFYDWSQ